MKRAFLLFAIALPAYADRFNVAFEGKPVSGAEVCASRAGDLASPVTRFLTGGEPTCYPANGEVRLPPGSWNVYARRGTELIGDSAVLVMDGESKRHDLSVVRTASVDGAEKGSYAYVVATGALIPIDGAVPATRIVPLIVSGQHIRAIGVPLTPEAGKKARFEFQPDGALKGSVVIPITVGAPPKGKATPPEVMLAGAKQLADSALLFFRGVPAGAQQITLAGDRWKSETRPVKVDAGTITVAAPIVARSGSKLRIHWWASTALASLAHPERQCGKKPDVPPAKLDAFAISLLECTGQTTDSPFELVRRQCSAVASRDLSPDAMKGVFELPDIGAGLYLVRLSYPALPPILKSIRVAPEDLTDVDLEIRYVTLFGKVTRGGKPLHVRVFGAVTDPETGEYNAAMIKLPNLRSPIRLEPCDGGPRLSVVPDELPVENVRYDIELPENRLTVYVIDAESHAPIEKASVNMTALESGSDHDARLTGMAGLTNAEGMLIIESVPADKRLRICVLHPKYESGCADRFELGGEREKTVDVALKRGLTRLGRVVLPGPQLGGSIAWYSPAGDMTEVAIVKEDGTFEFKRAHAAGEIVTYSSANQPFIGMRQPPLNDDQVFEIRPAPGARLRTFQVALSREAHEFSYFTIALGDMIVPEMALMKHISMHGVPPNLEPGSTATVPDIVESAPIRVILIPRSFAQSHDNPAIDMAMHPEVHTLPQQLLGERTRVEFH